jgi:hypothetical protein
MEKGISIFFKITLLTKTSYVYHTFTMCYNSQCAIQCFTYIWYGKCPKNSITLIIQTPLNLSHVGNLFVHNTVVLIIRTPSNLGKIIYTVRINRASTVIERKLHIKPVTTTHMDIVNEGYNIYPWLPVCSNFIILIHYLGDGSYKKENNFSHIQYTFISRLTDHQNVMSC